MEPRKLTALIGALVVFAMPAAQAEPQTQVAPTVTKCVVNGITTYSDKPCPEGIDERQIAVDNAPPVVLVASENRTPRPVRDARCDAAAAELHNIDALTRQGQPPEMQAFLDARRQQKRNELFRFRC
ncbi:MAG: hypothetical protein K0R89_3356 [Ramlibacter sp.]|jgi:hypothetical protein|nr:hypothetical protein [Ramlibacter sp.]